MNKKYLAMDIGCIECGEESAVIGIYDTEEQANKAIKKYINPRHKWGKEGRTGQHFEEVFEVEL
jgi:hypothetical protein